MTSSSETRLAYIEEVTYGTTPATPVFQEQRFTGEGMNSGLENITSNEIRADRNVADLIQVGAQSGGNVDFELSYGSFDDWLESLMYSTWSANVLKNGVAQKSFTIEKTFESGATDQYHRLTGSIADTLTLSMQTQQIVTGSFGFASKNYTTAQAIIAGATYTGANTNPVIDAASSFGNLSITGVTSPELVSCNLSITNNLRQQQVLGSVEARGVAAGRFEVSGDLTAYFENEELFDLFLAGTGTDLVFRLGGASSLKYDFNLGNIKFETGEVVAGGNDQDVLASMSFRALYDGVDNTLEITRTP